MKYRLPSEVIINDVPLSKILEAHLLWLSNSKNGIRANLKKADLQYVDLNAALLKGVNLEKANLTGANLSGADLTKADLTKAILYRTNLTGANLTGANFYRAIIKEAIFTEADLAKANLAKANLTGVIVTDINILKDDIAKVMNMEFGFRDSDVRVERRANIIPVKSIRDYAIIPRTRSYFKEKSSINVLFDSEISSDDQALVLSLLSESYFLKYGNRLKIDDLKSFEVALTNQVLVP